ncbi:MAG: 50S ribosomal protein L25/general stress protein Ctc [Syntrophobacteria bacterium]
MAVSALKAQLREKTGKGVARSLRRQGFIPAVFYGPGVEPVPLAFSSKDLDRLFGGGSGEYLLIDLNIENGESTQKHRAMIKEVQTDPVKQNILHIDLYGISMDKKITVEVPITLTGVSLGVTEGGILQQVRRTIEISCLPGRIPEALKVDMSNLGIGESVHVSDLDVPTGIELLAEEHLTIASVVPPARAEEIEPEILEAGEEVEEAAEVTEEQGEQE